MKGGKKICNSAVRIFLPHTSDLKMITTLRSTVSKNTQTTDTKKYILSTEHSEKNIAVHII